MTATNVQRALACYLRRAVPAGDAAGDGRRVRSAAALAELASWVERLPPDDERLIALAALPAAAEDGFRLAEEAQWMVWRYGTGRVAEDRDAWLRGLVDVCRSEADDAEPRFIDLTDPT